MDLLFQILGRDRDDLHLVRGNPVMLEDKTEKLGAAVSALDNADGLVDQLADLLDLIVADQATATVALGRISGGGWLN